KASQEDLMSTIGIFWSWKNPRLKITVRDYLEAREKRKSGKVGDTSCSTGLGDGMLFDFGF
ncbi:MAG: hypothetical protein ACOY0S_01925, partial [Patescibacteria group bacterium]